MKNILFVLPRSLYPLESGGMQAIFNGIIALIDHYYIILTYIAQDTQEEVYRKEKCAELFDGKVIVIPCFTPQLPSRSSILYRCVNKFNKLLDRIYKVPARPYNIYSYWINELLPQPKIFINLVNKIIDEYHIDIVQCEMLCTLSLVQSLPSQVKKVFVHHELGFVRHKLELDKWPQSEEFDGHSYCQCSKKLEISQLNLYDRIITLSSTDSQKLKDAGVTTKIDDSFAIVKRYEFKDNNIDHNPLQLTFIGPDLHGPNLQGIQWFLDNCWEQLLANNPNYHLTIIGHWSPKNIEIFKEKYKNVSFAGFVDNLAKALQGTVMIVPITIGSGIRMKILEASNLGIPFVSTSIGAEGIPVVSGKHCLIADTAAAFADAVIQMKDIDAQREMAANAKKLIQSYYSLENLRQNRLEIYSSIMEE